MNLRRWLLTAWLVAAAAWLVYLATRFDLVRMGAIPLHWFAAEAIVPPLALWVLWLVVRRIGGGFFRSK